MKELLEALSPFGRTNRVSYFGRALVGALLMLPAGIVGRLVMTGDLVLPPFQPTIESVVIHGALAFAILLLVLGAAIMQMATVRRCHDLGWSGYWTLPFLIAPVVGSITGYEQIASLISTPISILALFAPGQQLANRFGAPPEPFDTEVPAQQQQPA